MEWWQIAPLVLAVIVFLLAGTVIERHLESAVMRIIRRQPALSQATVGVDSTTPQSKQEQFFQEQLLQKQHDLAQAHATSVLENKSQERKLLGTVTAARPSQRQLQEIAVNQQLQQEVLQHQMQLVQRQQQLQNQLQNQVQPGQYTIRPEVKSEAKKIFPNWSVHRQRLASQATLRAEDSLPHRQPEPQLQLLPLQKLLENQEQCLQKQLENHPLELSKQLPEDPLQGKLMSQEHLLLQVEQQLQVPTRVY